MEICIPFYYKRIIKAGGQEIRNQEGKTPAGQFGVSVVDAGTCEKTLGSFL